MLAKWLGSFSDILVGVLLPFTSVDGVRLEHESPDGDLLMRVVDNDVTLAGLVGASDPWGKKRKILMS